MTVWIQARALARPEHMKMVLADADETGMRRQLAAFMRGSATTARRAEALAFSASVGGLIAFGGTISDETMLSFPVSPTQRWYVGTIAVVSAIGALITGASFKELKRDAQISSANEFIFAEAVDRKEATLSDDFRNRTARFRELMGKVDVLLNLSALKVRQASIAATTSIVSLTTGIVGDSVKGTPSAYLDGVSNIAFFAAAWWTIASFTKLHRLHDNSKNLEQHLKAQARSVDVAYNR